MMSRFVLVLFFLVASICMCQAAIRQKRGFRNSALSTARGFGKRMQPSEVMEELNLRSDFTRPIATNWLADEISRNPTLAKLLVEKVLDQNGDGIINPEEMFQSL